MHSKYPPISIVSLKRDLRLEDHEALYSAFLAKQFLDFEPGIHFPQIKKKSTVQEESKRILKQHIFNEKR